MGHALSEEAPAPSLQRGEQRGEQGMLERLRKSGTEQKRRNGARGDLAGLVRRSE